MVSPYLGPWGTKGGAVRERVDSQSCVSTSEKWYHCNSRRWRVEPGVRAPWPSYRFTACGPGGMYSPWITTMSSGHDVSEYELGASGLPRAYVSSQQAWKNWLKIEKNHDFCKKKKILVWGDDPPEDPVISIFAGCLANHDHTHSRNRLVTPQDTHDQSLSLLSYTLGYVCLTDLVRNFQVGCP